MSEDNRVSAGVVQLAGQGVELVVQGVAQRGGAGDECDRDKGGDEAVLDCSGAGFVFDETIEKILHGFVPSSTCVFSTPPAASVGRMSRS
ncbi:hypothetical protein HOE425_333443 [Hoeflea sp. EC-HK425]|nr:hypothetical protein HOE425_333443 [Hoeflea sp. EC-HK425]